MQAGGGIVADSRGEFEYQESINKASAPLLALEIADPSQHVSNEFFATRDPATTAQSWLMSGHNRTGAVMLNGFKNFLMRGNLIVIAVGFGRRTGNQYVDFGLHQQRHPHPSLTDSPVVASVWVSVGRSTTISSILVRSFRAIIYFVIVMFVIYAIPRRALPQLHDETRYARVRRADARSANENLPRVSERGFACRGDEVSPLCERGRLERARRNLTRVRNSVKGD